MTDRNKLGGEFNFVQNFRISDHMGHIYEMQIIWGKNENSYI